jgi:hypothetical protein
LVQAAHQFLQRHGSGRSAQIQLHLDLLLSVEGAEAEQSMHLLLLEVVGLGVAPVTIMEAAHYLDQARLDKAMMEAQLLELLLLQIIHLLVVEGRGQKAAMLLLLPQEEMAAAVQSRQSQVHL